ncbi:MAG: rhodanese-like domain-containing protein, partial [Bacteroidia bacterium]
MGFFSSLFGNNDNTQLLEVIKEGAYLVDVRSAGEFSSGSVKGATNIPLESLANHIVKLKGKKSIVVFCRSGNRSSMAKSLLEQGGLKN